MRPYDWFSDDEQLLLTSLELFVLSMLVSKLPFLGIEMLYEYRYSVTVGIAIGAMGVAWMGLTDNEHTKL